MKVAPDGCLGCAGEQAEERGVPRHADARFPHTHDNGGPDHAADALRYLGSDAPADVLAAETRCLGWRPFAPHTDQERAAHAADLAAVDGWLANRARYDLPGADPMGDD